MTLTRVLAVTSEIYPIIKTGGLADVAGALPAALKAHDVEMRTLVPGYPAVMRALPKAVDIRRWPGYFGGPARLDVTRSSSKDFTVPIRFPTGGSSIRPAGFEPATSSSGGIIKRLPKSLEIRFLYRCYVASVLFASVYVVLA